jgi:hypothetical protein
MSFKDVVSKNRANNENVQHSNFTKKRFLNEDWQLREIHDLFHHFFLNFSYMWISFQSCIDLHIENSNVNFRLNRVRIDFDRDRHVEFFRIFDDMNQFVLNRNKHEFMSNHSSLAKFVHFFEISTVFVNVFFVNQNINIIDVFKKFRVRFEFVVFFK